MAFSADCVNALAMQPILIRCPVTKALVQHLIADSADTSDHAEYEPFECPSCRRIHLVNKAGKLLGDNA